MQKREREREREEFNNFTIFWVKAHRGDEGNETANHLAKMGASIPLIKPELTLGNAHTLAMEAIKNL